MSSESKSASSPPLSPRQSRKELKKSQERAKDTEPKEPRNAQESNGSNAPEHNIEPKHTTEAVSHKPAHHEHKLFQARPSLLSSEATVNVTGHGGYRGFLNLAIILLGITNFRLIVLNLLKYGILLDFAPLYAIEWQRWPSVIILAVLNAFVLVGYILELLAARDALTEHNLLVLQIMNICAMIIVPSSLVWTMQPTPGSGIIVMLLMTCAVAKMISYAHVNHNLRHEARESSKVNNGWPLNLNFSNLYYFMAVPTLIYQTEYPRTEKIRKGWLARRILEAIFFSFLVVAIVEQYIVPLVHNSLVPFKAMDLIRIGERAMKLSIPNVYVWLIGFYAFFHLYLNIAAEILRFADRQFYKDWWNSTTLQYFWKNWNLPVNTWMYHTVYFPLIRRGYRTTTAAFSCFFISALFHELIIAVPFQMIKGWAFLGMLSQVPLIKITNGLKGHQLGNVIFWFSIVLGQPFIVLLMYRGWYQRNFGGIIDSEI